MKKAEKLELLRKRNNKIYQEKYIEGKSWTELSFKYEMSAPGLQTACRWLKKHYPGDVAELERT